MAVGLTVAVLIGCQDSSQSYLDTRTERPSVAEFKELFVESDSILLEQPADRPIVGMGGVDFSQNGSIAFSDGRESHIKLFSPNGKLSGVIGRRGSGPGEFRAPGPPRFDVLGRIHVPDLMLGRMYTFEPSGALVRSATLPAAFRINDFEVLDDGYLVVGVPWEKEGGAVLMSLDSLGIPLSVGVHIADMHPAGQPEDQRWGTILSTSFLLVSDTVFITHSLIDSVWAVPLSDFSQVRSRVITPLGYEAPTLPEEDLTRDLEKIGQWSAEQMRAVTIEGNEDLILVPFFRGAYRGPGAAPSSAAYRNKEGEWLTLQNAPPVVRMRGDTLYTLDRPDLENIIIRSYSRIK